MIQIVDNQIDLNLDDIDFMVVESNSACSCGCSDIRC